MVNTQVTKVVQTGTLDGLPIFSGVEFAQNASGMYVPGSRTMKAYRNNLDLLVGPVYSLNATREVLLSAGPIKTPQIRKLMPLLSGYYIRF